MHSICSLILACEWVDAGIVSLQHIPSFLCITRNDSERSVFTVKERYRKMSALAPFTAALPYTYKPIAHNGCQSQEALQSAHRIASHC